MKKPEESSADPGPAAAGAAEVAGLVEVMAKLRSEEGCPWDREQTWDSLRRYVLEEAYELVDAVDRKDPAAVLEECGDLLLEVVFMAQIAHEEGRFGMAEVARGITRKLIRRHPHVFGDQERASDADEAFARWEAIKATEKPGRAASGDRLPRGLPALLLAMKAVERAGTAEGAEETDHERHPSRPRPDAGRAARGRPGRTRDGARRPAPRGRTRGPPRRTRPRVRASQRGPAATPLNHPQRRPPPAIHARHTLPPHPSRAAAERRSPTGIAAAGRETTAPSREPETKTTTRR